MFNPMPAPLMSKFEVVDRLMRVFRRFGYDGASVSRLSEATGLGKASLYHYFPGGKEDMAGAVLEHTEAWLAEHVVAVLRGPGPPAERLRRMAANLNRLYNGGREGCVLGGMVVGEARALFHDRLKHSFKLWIDALADLVAETGVPRRIATERAEETIAALQGALVLSGAIGSCHPFRRALAVLPERLLRPAHVPS